MTINLFTIVSRVVTKQAVTQISFQYNHFRNSHTQRSVAKRSYITAVCGEWINFQRSSGIMILRQHRWKQGRALSSNPETGCLSLNNLLYISFCVLVVHSILDTRWDAYRKPPSEHVLAALCKGRHRTINSAILQNLVDGAHQTDLSTPFKLLSAIPKFHTKELCRRFCTPSFFPGIFTFSQVMPGLIGFSTYSRYRKFTKHLLRTTFTYLQFLNQHHIW